MGQQAIISNQETLRFSTLIDMLQHQAAHLSDRLAFQYLQNGDEEGLSMTYSQLDRRARSISAVLQKKALERQRVLLLFHSGLEFVATYFGCLYTNVVSVPAYPPKGNHHMNRLQAIINDSGASAVLTTSQVLENVMSAGRAQNLQDIEWIAVDTIDEEEAALWSKPDNVNSDTLAFLQYTSGSTGSPKGVMVTHGNLLHNFHLMAGCYGLNEETPILSWLPLFHDMGLIGKVLTSVYTGSPLYLMSPMDFIQRPKRWLNAISKYRIYYSGAPNFAYDMAVRKTKPEERAQWDFSCWKVAMNGAEPIHAETLRTFTKTFEPYGFREIHFNAGYGLAEATLMVSGRERSKELTICQVSKQALNEGRATDPLDESDLKEVVGCGQTWLGQEVIAVDPVTLHTCKEDEVGEIWIKGDSVAKGYWQKPEISKEVFEAHTSDTGEGPFLRTGDLGFIRNGEIFITGRIKDMMIVHGQNHYPQDIEYTIETCHDIFRPNCSAAFTVTQDGEECLVVVAEVQRKYWPVSKKNLADNTISHRTPIAIEDILMTARQAVSEIHQIRLTDLVLLKEQSIPKTSSGKIQRRACKHEYLNGTLTKWGENI